MSPRAKSRPTPRYGAVASYAGVYRHFLTEAIVKRARPGGRLVSTTYDPKRNRTALNFEFPGGRNARAVFLWSVSVDYKTVRVEAVRAPRREPNR